MLPSSGYLFPPLHPQEYKFSLEVLKSLLKSQCPQHASFQLKPLVPGGTDHFMIRLGDEYIARLPRHPGATYATEIERTWLQFVASHTTVPVPAPLFQGQPGPDYPAYWSITPWIEGETADVLLHDAHHHDRRATHHLAHELGKFVKSLRKVPTYPTMGPHPTSYRTEALATRTSVFREALSQCEDVFDSQRLLQIWTNHLEAIGPDDGQQIKAFAHGDLQPSNIIISKSLAGELSGLAGIIDWGGLSVGDPAIDLLPAWMLFENDTRRIFLEAADPDNKMWLRGRAWALSVGIIAYPYYRHTRPDHAAMSKRQIEEVVKDAEGT